MRWEAQQEVPATLMTDMEQAVRSARRATGLSMREVAKALDVQLWIAAGESDYWCKYGDAEAAPHRLRAIPT